MDFASIKAQIEQNLAPMPSDFTVSAWMLEAFAETFGVTVGDLLAAEIRASR